MIRAASVKTLCGRGRGESLERVFYYAVWASSSNCALATSTSLSVVSRVCLGFCCSLSCDDMDIMRRFLHVMKNFSMGVVKNKFSLLLKQ